MNIVGPESVVHAHLRYPLLLPDLTLYEVQTEKGRYLATEAPLLRDAKGQKMTLDEELWIGSIVKLALTDRGLLYAVQVLCHEIYDPFASVAATD